MADIKGTLCLVQVGDVASSPSTYDTLEGQTDASFGGGTNIADTTAKDNAGWQTGVATTKSGTISVSGNLRTSRPAFERLRAAWIAGTTHACKILLDGTLGYVGEFWVDLSFSAPTQDVVKYSMTLTPASGLTAVP